MTDDAEDLSSDVRELSRRKFMANATVTVGGLMALGLAIPIVGSLLPKTDAGSATWTALDETGWNDLQAATDTPVSIHFKARTKDAYLPEGTLVGAVYGIKIKDTNKFKTNRPDLFSVEGNETLPYRVVNLGFAIFSPICPHLGCHYEWTPAANRFVCKCHGSQFDRDGAHVAGPAARGLDPLPLRERSGKAQVEWIRYKPTIPDRIIISYSN